MRGGAAWTKNEFARDLYGLACDPLEPRAVCWCALGAIYAEVDTERDFQAASAPLRLRGDPFPVRVNDHAGSFRTVEEMYQRAIASLGDT